MKDESLNDQPLHGEARQPRIFCLECGYPLDGLREHRCPECGKLFDPHDPETFSVQLALPVKLYTARDAMEAHFLRGILMQHGIAATVLGELLGTARGELPLTQETLPAVWVSSDEAEEAAQVIADFLQENQSEVGAVVEPWTCPGCGESIEGQFDVCWNCGATRPNEIT